MFLSDGIVISIIIILIIIIIIITIIIIIIIITHDPPDDTVVRTLHQSVHKEKDEALQERCENVRNSQSSKTGRAADFAMEKGASGWLTVIPLEDMDYTLSERELRDAVHLRYDWQTNDIPSVCVCGDKFSADRAMICRRGDFIIKWHNELRDLEAEMLNQACVMMLKWNQSYRRSPAKTYQEVLIEPLTRDLTSTRGAFGQGKVLLSLMSGCATHAQNPAKTLRPSKFIVNMRTRRSDSTAPEFLKWNKPPLPL